MSRSELRARPPRVLLAKPGMDGHNRGINVIAKSLREAGCEVIYLGIRRSAAQISQAAVQEDVHAVGLSVLSGAHIELCRDVLLELRRSGAADIPVVVGGIIPDDDHAALREMGVAAIFTPGARLNEIADTVWKLSTANAGESAARTLSEPT